MNGLGIRSFSSVKVKVLLRELHMIIIQDFSCGRKGVNTAIFTRQTCMDSKVVRAEFGSGLIRNWAQACMDSKVVRADFGSGLIRLRAQTCCALKSSAPSGAHQDNCADLLGLQTRRGSNHSAAHVGESNSRSNVFQIRRESVCVSSVEKFCRASSAGGRRHLQ